MTEHKLISMEEFDERYPALCEGIDATLIEELGHTSIAFPPVEELRILDPFSEEYRSAALRIHALLRRSEAPYDPHRDEKSAPLSDNLPLFQSVPPWAFRDTKYTSQFFASWANIFRLLDLKDRGSVLEYGPGSGQILLMLARCGFDVYGVDIDEASLETVRGQAAAMQLTVHLEQAQFGQGFEGRKFDRILFFEAFHHAFDFPSVLRGLRERLNPGGKIVFCGEPIVDHEIPCIPFPWGPRLDATAVFCVRRYGWMELGFTHDFFTEILQRCGFEVEFHRVETCGRATAYVATPGEPRSRAWPIPLPPPPILPVWQRMIECRKAIKRAVYKLAVGREFKRPDRKRDAA